jgi:thiosulfate/3-mercaptopyruvate sulfurtransferase
MTYANPHFLWDTESLANRLGDPGLRLFEVTGMLTAKLENIAREKCYDEGHIPGAVYLDVASPKGDLSDPDAPLPWTWPPPRHFETVMGRLGVGNDSQVVLYAATPRKGIDSGVMWSTRAWWVMHHYGVRCAVLDGGWEKWLDEGRPAAKEPGGYPPARFTAQPDWRRALATREDVLAALGASGSACVVNALSAESHAGADPVKYGPRKGHITGSVSVPMQSLVEPETGTFAGAGEMRRHFEAAGALSPPSVITYCGGGIAATVDAFALALLGQDNVAVYDNSLIEWSADPALPMTDPSADS